MKSQSIDSILAYNRGFVASKGYEAHLTDKYPARKLAVLSCMDTRLSVLLQEALGLKNGDAKIIKNAGGIIPSETDSSIRSLLVAIYELGVFQIDVNYMIPLRGAGRSVSGGYSVKVDGAVIDSHLPYAGVARSVPYGGGKVLTFQDDISYRGILVIPEEPAE